MPSLCEWHQELSIGRKPRCSKLLQTTFTSNGKTCKITLYPAAQDSKKYPALFFLHGNFGLGRPYGDQIQSFAATLAAKGYFVAVPQYYADDEPHLTDTATKKRILADAIQSVASRTDADLDRLGLVGFSLGAATAMTFIATEATGCVKVLADFIGLVAPTVEGGLTWDFSAGQFSPRF